MKSKKIMSLLLSAIMLVSAMPGLVLAEEEVDDDPYAAGEGYDPDGENPDEDNPDIPDDEDPDEDNPDIPDEEDPDIPDEDDPDIPDGEDAPDPNYLGEMTEGKVFLVDYIEAKDDEDESKGKRTLTFTPSTTGRYGFLCADGRMLAVTVFDADGQEVSPLESDSDFRYDIKYLRLQAGETYIFKIVAEDKEYDSSSVKFFIDRMDETLPLGESTVFVRGYDSSAKYSFIPEEDGQYVFEFSVEGYEISASIYENKNRINWTSTRANGIETVVADLAGGVQYDLSLYTYQQDIYYNLVNVKISKGIPTLEEGVTEVTLGPNLQNTILTFTPESTGVYVFYSTGNYNTEGTLTRSGYNYGDGDNFKFSAYLESGKSYYVKVFQFGATEVTVQVHVEEAPEAVLGQEYTFEAKQGTANVYSFTPENTGWYLVDTGDASRNLIVYDSMGYGVSPSEDCFYFTAGETYVIECVNNGSDGQITMKIVQPFAALVEDKETELPYRSTRNGFYYALFTPSSTGTYVFTSELSYSSLYLYTKDGTYKRTSLNGNSLEYSIPLTGGTTYLITAYSGSDQNPKTMTVAKAPETGITLGAVNEVTLASREAKYYPFTPSESGYYIVYSLEGLGDAPYVYEGGRADYLEHQSSGTSFRCRVVKLEAGTSYSIYMNNSQYSDLNVRWGINKVGEFELGQEATVNVLGQYAYYAFTPSVTGVYTFSSEMFEEANSADIKRKTPYFSGIMESFTWYKNSISLVLEEGETYLLYVKLQNNDSTTSFIARVDQEKALELGDNTVPIEDRQTSWNAISGVCSFTPSEDGLYAFTSTDTSDHAPSIEIYEFENTQKTQIARDSGSGEDDNFKLEVELKAGRTYYINIEDYDDPYELPVVVSKVEELEARLAGYTLSLDGSIAVNLYMSLSDTIAHSPYAYLLFTQPNGNGIMYMMSDADTKEVDGQTYYVFHLPVAAKEMTVGLKVQVIDMENDFEGREYTFTVKQYADYIIENAYDWSNNGAVLNQEFADAIPLVKALLNYGAYAQLYFDYHTDDLANVDLSTSDMRLGNVPTSRLPAYDSSTEVLPDGVTFEGASLTLISETVLTLYFKNTTGKEMKFMTEDGTVMRGGRNGEYTTVRITGIAAHELGQYVNLKVLLTGDSGDYHVSYCPMTYCYNVLTRPMSASRTAELKDLMKAFYFYNKEAEQYLNN